METTGRTIEEAKEGALDQLGVDEHDAEFEVLEEPRLGLFGRLRVEARVRARVRPSRPRPKEDRRDRRRRRGGQDARGGAAPGGGGALEGDVPAPPPTDDPVEPGAEAVRPQPQGDQRARQVGAAASPPGQSDQGGANRGGSRMDQDVPLREQAEVAQEFLTGLLAAFGTPASIATRDVDEDTVELAVEGGALGLLIGPRGTTLNAVQELTRTVVQRQTGGRNGRLVVDVGGYRQKRRAALERFTREVAARVRASGSPQALEPMHPADRKVVHDTVNELEGVTTTSQGQEPRRWVVIEPD